MSVYVPPAGSGAGSSDPGFCSGGCGTLADNQRTYLAGYFNAHMLSTPSWRYMYLLWIVAAALALGVAGAHHARLRQRSGSLGARWLRWTIRSRTVALGRSKGESRGESVAGRGHTGSTTHSSAARMLGHAAPRTPTTRRRRTLVLPPVGTLCMGFVLLVIPVLLTLIGADYVRPSAGVFDLGASFPNITDPTQSLTALPQVSRRDVWALRQGGAAALRQVSQGGVAAVQQASQGGVAALRRISPRQLARSTAQLLSPRRLHWGIGAFPAVATIVATVTIPYRTWWTAGGRTGIMTNALTPMVVLLALKAPPFALLATRALGGFGFDRLAFLHKWGGRLVWLFAAVHVALWSVQLRLDYAFGGNMWAFVFLWQRFRWGFVSFGFLTLLTLLSLGPIRRDHYEFFYVAHIVCAVGTMVAAALHHPPLGAWMWAALAWWGAERLFRAARTAWTNGVGFAGRKPQFVVGEQSWPQEKPPAWHGAQHGGPQHGYSDVPLAGPPPGWASRAGPLSSQGGHSVDSSSATMLSSPPAKSAWLSHDPQPMRGAAPLQHERIALHDEPAGMQMQTLHAEGLAGDGLDRRRTRRSARYDPVSDVIDDYSMNEDAKRFSSSADLYNQAYSSSDSAWSATAPTAPLPPHFAPMQSDPSASSHASHATAPYPPPFGHQAQASFSRPTTPRALQSHAPRPAMGADIAAVIRPGYAFAQVLPGKTLRLTLRTPNAVSWRPGQYVNLNVPAVRWWESHPFTVASAYDANFKSSTIFGDDDETPSARAKGEERTMVLLLRARHGFTRHLWNYVCDRREEQLLAAGQAARKATTGVHVRALVDGPYGSTASVRWGEHASVLIICGGSGVSYGMAVLEHLCACLSQARQKGFVTTRVRFVWMLREFSHLQWVASALRRCTELVGAHQLQVDLFVTHFNQIETRLPAQTTPYSDGSASRSHTPAPSYTDAAGFTEAGAAQGEEYNVDAYDLTQFEGEDYSAPSATEMKINERLHSEGKLRRAKTRRATMRKKAGRGGAASRPGRTAPPLPSTQLDLGEPSGPLGDAALLAPPNPFADDGYTSSGPPSPNLLPLLSPGIVPAERPPSMLKTQSSSRLSAYAGSTHGLLAPDIEAQAANDEVLLDLDADEDADLRHVAELAHPGRPRLDRIVQEEARAARGTSLLVTSCGPSGLGALLRAVVAKEIDPQGIGKGTAPRIELRNETYEWGGS